MISSANRPREHARLRSRECWIVAQAALSQPPLPARSGIPDPQPRGDTKAGPRRDIADALVVATSASIPAALASGAIGRCRLPLLAARCVTPAGLSLKPVEKAKQVSSLLWGNNAAGPATHRSGRDVLPAAECGGQCRCADLPHVVGDVDRDPWRHDFVNSIEHVRR